RQRDGNEPRQTVQQHAQHRLPCHLFHENKVSQLKQQPADEDDGKAGDAADKRPHKFAEHVSIEQEHFQASSASSVASCASSAASRFSSCATVFNSSGTRRCAAKMRIFSAWGLAGNPDTNEPGGMSPATNPRAATTV